MASRTDGDDRSHPQHLLRSRLEVGAVIVAESLTQASRHLGIVREQVGGPCDRGGGRLEARGWSKV